MVAERLIKPVKINWKFNWRY